MAFLHESHEQDSAVIPVPPERNCFLDVTDSSDIEEGILDDLELNPFDGLPYSSRFYNLLRQREELPIWKMKYAFVESLLHNQIVVVSGGAKSGKSSQGYCTDDMLLREMMSNTLLSGYGVVIIDEVYQRSVSTDVLLGLLKDIVVSRPELKVVIITSPDLSSKLVSYYGNVPVIEVAHTYSVEVVYSSGIQRDYFFSAVRLLFEIHHTKEKGDIVVFLACEQEIKRAYELIKHEGSHINPDLGELVPIPLYPHQNTLEPLPCEGEDRGCKDHKRKVVLTTSFGESLIWMSNIYFVIDVGVERRKVYNARIRAESLVMQPVSKARAEMRKQILGSSPSGKMFCLYTEEFTQNEMKTFLPAKIKESNLTSMVLFLKRMDIAGLGRCEFINRPAVKIFLAACEFDCVDMKAHAWLHAPNCFMDPSPGAEEADTTHRTKFLHSDGDHFTLIQIYKEYEHIKKNRRRQYDIEKWCQDYFLNLTALETAQVIRTELLDIMKRIELPISEPAFGSEENVQNIKKSLLSGYFMQIARDVDGLGNYIMLTHKQVAQLHPFSGYCNSHKIPEWVLFHEFSVSDKSCIRITSEISPDLFVQFAPQYYFSNLPPSESKEILQKALDYASPTFQRHQEEDVYDDYAASSAEQRCIIQ
ncbi:hypothetical protein FKM82_014587 [Ascaphus truei]